MHAVKMAALLQVEAANGPERPILLRVDAKAGHGVGKPIAKLVDDAVDVWSFLFWQLGIKAVASLHKSEQPIRCSNDQ
jgi:prolyl oligopeptidase